MISDRYPYVPLTWQTEGAQGDDWALIDTGFDGYLALPEQYLNRMSRPRADLRYSLADNQVVSAPVYLGYVQFGELEVTFPAQIMGGGVT